MVTISIYVIYRTFKGLNKVIQDSQTDVNPPLPKGLFGVCAMSTVVVVFGTKFATIRIRMNGRRKGERKEWREGGREEMMGRRKI